MLSGEEASAERQTLNPGVIQDMRAYHGKSLAYRWTGKVYYNTRLNWHELEVLETKTLWYATRIDNGFVFVVESLEETDFFRA